MNRLTLKKYLIGIFCISTVFGCAGSNDSGSTAPSSLVLSGVLGGTGVASNKVATMAAINDANSQSVSLSDLEIYAIAFTTPPVIAQASVNTDGSFSVQLPGAKGSSVTAVFRNKTSAAEVGVIKFVDSSKKDMKGNASASSSVVLSDSVSLGNLTLGSDGTVQVPISNISSAIGSSDSVAASKAFDPTGTWTVGAYDGTLPSGYGTATANSNKGPKINETITLVRLAGKEFTPTSGQCTITNGTLTGSNGGVCTTSNGQVGSADRYALSIWGSTYANSIGACGGNIGFTADQARAFGLISIESSGIPQSLGAINLAPYTWSYDVTNFGGTGIAPYDQPWMRQGATASHPFENCKPWTISNNSNSYDGWACRSEIKTGNWGSGSSTGTYGWNVSVQGSGCIDATTNKPVNVSNWSQIGQSSSCNQPVDSSSTYGTGFKTNTCTYSNVDHDGDANTANLSFKCSFTGGQFTESSGNPTTTELTLSGQYLDRPQTLISQGGSCAVGGASATTEQKNAGFRCYAEAYWNGTAPSGSCQPEFQFNWQAPDLANFVMKDYQGGKPKNAFITNILQYALDGQSATLEDHRSEKISLPTGNGRSTFCEVKRTTTLGIKALTNSRMIVDFKESGHMASLDAACIAAANAALTNASGSDSHIKEMLSSDKMLFYLNK